MSKSRLNSENIDRLQRTIDYQFKQQPELLVRALTHRSFGADNFERLEFLGDSILGFVIADNIFERFPDANEGQLTRLRASLVRQETLAELARDLELGDYLVLGPGALKSGDQSRDSVLSDVLESIIGAIYLDGGLQPCRRFVKKLFSRKLALCAADKVYKDSKTRLQELLQKNAQPLPDYSILKKSGPPHRQTFTVQCQIGDGQHNFVGKGPSRRKAEQDAAEKALLKLSSKELA